MPSSSDSISLSRPDDAGIKSYYHPHFTGEETKAESG